MRTRPNLQALMREMQTKGFDERQSLRYDSALRAAQLAVLALLCARDGACTEEMLEAVHISPRLAADATGLVARMETSSAFVRHIHSGLRF